MSYSKSVACLATAFMLIGVDLMAHASSPDAWAKLDADSAKACIAASGLSKAKVSASTHFSDAAGYDVRVVSGIYPQKHMKGAAGQMLCLYGRKSKLVEVQELVK